MVSFGPLEYKGWKPWGKVVFFSKSILRYLRISKPLTWVLGAQYKRSRELIEIDITYDCNSRCYNCNRSCRQAPSDIFMEVKQIEHFIEESEQKEKKWKRIRVLGGEPTLHPQITEILRILVDAFAKKYGTVIELVTNGIGNRAKEILQHLPDGVYVENSTKKGNINEHFRVFSIAPIDLLRYRMVSFKNGCDIPYRCGLGLTPFGYYCCALAGGIDRVIGLDTGRKKMPDDSDKMEEHFETFCRFCGRFIDGHFIPRNLRRPLTEERISSTWEKIYAEYKQQRPRLTRY